VVQAAQGRTAAEAAARKRAQGSAPTPTDLGAVAVYHDPLSRHFGGICEAGADIVRFEGGIVLQDPLGRHAVGKEVDDERYPDPVAANARPPVADVWVSRDTVQEAVVNHKCRPVPSDLSSLGRVLRNWNVGDSCVQHVGIEVGIVRPANRSQFRIDAGLGEELGVMQRLEHAGELHQLRHVDDALRTVIESYVEAVVRKSLDRSHVSQQCVGSWLSGEASGIGAPTKLSAHANV
jgi:hypothetical protein